jgi:hypothetical protein
MRVFFFSTLVKKKKKKKKKKTLTQPSPACGRGLSRRAHENATKPPHSRHAELVSASICAARPICHGMGYGSRNKSGMTACGARDRFS